MPYTYKKEGSKYCVYKKDDGKKVGCTDGTKVALKKYLSALAMHEEIKPMKDSKKSVSKKSTVINTKKVSEKTIVELKRMVAVAVRDVLKEGVKIPDKLRREAVQETPSLTTEEKQSYLEAISKFNEYGDAIYRNNKLKEAVSNIKKVVEFASTNMVEESGDWFDGVTVSRHAKRMQEAMNILEKAGNDATKLQQRMEAMYEEIGTMLNKYYEIKDKPTGNTKQIKEKAPVKPVKENDITEATLTAYKVRAEAPIDIIEFAKIAGNNLKNVSLDAGNVFSFKTTLSIDQIIALLKKVPDGHVMVRTLQPSKSFTGKEVRKEATQAVAESKKTKVRTNK